MIGAANTSRSVRIGIGSPQQQSRARALAAAAPSASDGHSARCELRPWSQTADGAPSSVSVLCQWLHGDGA